MNMIKLLRSLVRRDRHIWLKTLSVLGLSLLFTLVGWGVLTPSVLAEDYNKTNLADADFSGRDLRDSSFTKANLRNSNLSYADLRGVSLFGAFLKAANLEGANLSFATLESAQFARANLTNAILEGAFATNAQFEGATIEGADFTEVELRKDMRKQLCQMAQGVNPVTGRKTWDTLNCAG